MANPDLSSPLRMHRGSVEVMVPFTQVSNELSSVSDSLYKNVENLTDIGHDIHIISVRGQQTKDCRALRKKG